MLTVKIGRELLTKGEWERLVQIKWPEWEIAGFGQPTKRLRKNR